MEMMNITLIHTAVDTYTPHIDTYILSLATTGAYSHRCSFLKLLSAGADGVRSTVTASLRILTLQCLPRVPAGTVTVTITCSVRVS